MRIKLKLFALLSAYLPAGASRHEAELELAEGATPSSVIEALNLPPGMTHLVLVNGVYVAPAARAKTKLEDGDVVAIWPPVAGG